MTADATLLFILTGSQGQGRAGTGSSSVVVAELSSSGPGRGSIIRTGAVAGSGHEQDIDSKAYLQDIMNLSVDLDPYDSDDENVSKCKDDKKRR
jgi:hypothetical protein